MGFKTMKYRVKLKSQDYQFLRLLCRISKNIYNASLYEIKKYYLKTKKLIDYRELCRIMHFNENFRYLNNIIALQTIYKAYNAYALFVRKLKNQPNYIEKRSEFPIQFNRVEPIIHDNHRCVKVPLSDFMALGKAFTSKAKDPLLKEFIADYKYKKPVDIYLRVPSIIASREIKLVGIKPNGYAKDYVVAFSYQVPEQTFIPKYERFVAIDLGINNLATCVTIDNESFIIDGKVLKSKNQYYNKMTAYYQSLLPGDKHNSNRLKNLTAKRNYQVEDYLNKAVMVLIKHLKERNIDTMIIGKSDGFKMTGIRLEKVTSRSAQKKANQTFVQIPLLAFFDKLCTKAYENGIKVETVDEKNTSLASFYDDDSLGSTEFSGLRIRRGLYQTKDGHLVNADVNGALNILKRYICNSRRFSYDIIKRIQKDKITIPYRIQVLED